MDRIRVPVADDKAALREALAELVSSDNSMEIVGTAEDPDEAIKIART